MKKIIDGKLYNTETATELCNIGSTTLDHSRFEWWEATLYKTQKGAFFMVGEGHARSPFARSTGEHSWGPGHGLIPLSPDHARDYAERELSPDELAQHFTIEEA